MIIKKITSVMEENGLLKENDRVLVAVSGGPDSVFLLYLLNNLKRSLKLKIHVAHVNHNLRAEESDKDEDFVCNLSRRFQLPFFKCSVEVKKIAAREKLSIEEAARNLRYNFFSNICAVHKIEKIFLAHTKDDQVETIIMRLLRGTGLRGLCGMRQTIIKDKVRLIRPLLEVEKQEILAYLKKNKIKSRLDSSNLKPDYFRNKIRLEIIPNLIKYSPQVKENIFRLGENAKQVNEFIEEKADSAYRQCIKKFDGYSFRLKKENFLKLPLVLRNGVIRRIIENLKGDLTGIDFKHIKIANDFIEKDMTSGKLLDLPKSIKIIKTRRHVDFTDKNIKQKKAQQSVYEIKSPDVKLKIPEFNICFKCTVLNQNLKSKQLRCHSRLVEYFDLDRLNFPLKIRSRKKGDVFYPLGAGGRKKIKKFLIDQKIDDNLKDSIPLVVSGKKIVWVVGERIADNVKVTSQTKKILKIQAIKLKLNSR